MVKTKHLFQPRTHLSLGVKVDKHEGADEERV